MSWDTFVEEKQIEGLGTIHITRRSDDWGRDETDITTDNPNYHIETLYRRHHLDSWKSFYAVPNGMTISPSLNLPKLNFNSFIEQLCNEYSKSMLKEILETLNNKRVKFIYPMNTRTKLWHLSNIYYEYYNSINRDNCIQEVNKAIEFYDEYQYNYDKFKLLYSKAEKEQKEITQNAFAVSIFVY